MAPVEPDFIKIVESTLPAFSACSFEFDRETRVVTFARPSGAEYQFVIHYGEAVLQLSARPIGHPPETYFWYYPFEETFLNDPEADLQATFARVLRAVLGNPTRVSHTRRLFVWTCELEVLESSSWRSIYSHAALRGRLHVPKITGKSRVWCSPPVCAL